MRYSEDLRKAEILYLPDSPEFSGEMGRQLRLMRSDDGGITFEYAMQDKETRMMETVVDKLPTKIIITTSNALKCDPALESGAWNVEMDDSEDLTLSVQTERLKLRANNRPTITKEELEIWKAVMQIVLTEDLPTKISIPYAEKLIKLLSPKQSSQRRSPDKLCDLIEAIALFRRFQKLPAERETADLVDLYYALEIGMDALMKTISPLDERERMILKSILTKTNESTVRDVTTATRIAYNTAYQLLERLVDRGYLTKDSVKRCNVYSVTEEFEENEPKSLLDTHAKSKTGAIDLLKPIIESIDISSALIEVGSNTEIVNPLDGNIIPLPLEEMKRSIRRIIQPLIILETPDSLSTRDAKTIPVESASSAHGVEQRSLSDLIVEAEAVIKSSAHGLPPDEPTEGETAEAVG